MSTTVPSLSSHPMDNKCCDILKISYDFNETQLRDGYLESCRRAHPDVTHQHKNEVNGEEFTAIKSAYNRLKQYLKDNEMKSHSNAEQMEEEKDEGRHKHRVAQHRQYLTMDGIGCGTHSERQKYFQSHRLIEATDRVNEFQINQIKSNTHLSENELISVKNSKYQRKTKVKQGFDRLVEDLIQESMAKGDFDNLSGYGKPLKSRPEYPYLDATTFKLNEILINNGFVPEWVLLQKEIRDLKNDIKAQLMALKSKSKLDNVIEKQKLEEKFKEVNKMIEKYNRIVPILHTQQIHMNIEKEIQKAEDRVNKEVMFC
ncbi:unnamed protein product [Medioppia subpectinata]|uniref:DnaJ homologue subfamily C member 28 conserved domain-containing protein n=1 Tax=Medioppia subpectinata TaxID=1979941 RepID=A0A7R9PZ96_9ACAR|nr:unnamed protein product [Medioppia subpectinata]CAG2106244.1 unnamed protein product [Medioppia subpectinata]